MSDLLLGLMLENRDSVLVLTMPDEGKFNAAHLSAFNDALDKVEADPQILGLIITGRGKNFSQGLDLDYLSGLSAEGIADFVDQCMAMVGRLLSLPIPCCAAVNGHAFGLGAMLVLACDFKVMREDRGFFCLPEINLSMTLPASMNALLRSKLQGALLRDLLLGGVRIGGMEAAQRALVDRVCAETNLINESFVLMEPLVSKDRATFASLKRGINQDVLAIIEAAASGAS